MEKESTESENKCDYELPLVSIKIKKKALKAVGYFVDKKAHSYMRNTLIWVEPDHVIIGALDGAAMLLYFQQQEAVNEPCAFHADLSVIDKLEPLDLADDLLIETEVDRQIIKMTNIKITGDNASITVKTEPLNLDYRIIVPSGERRPIDFAQIDAAKIDLFYKAAKVIGGYPYIQLSQYGQHDNIMVNFLDDSDFFGMLMPLRQNSNNAGPKPLPEWLTNSVNN